MTKLLRPLMSKVVTVEAKKTLNEATIRRFQKLAKVAPINEMYHKRDDYMNEEEINMPLTSLLPVLKLEAGKYMIGTEKKPIQIKNDSLLIRVGGGYATLEEYLHQNGPFECIKIAKVMRDK